MAERPPNASTRPRPGPRPNPAAHGTNRRRVAQRTTVPRRTPVSGRRGTRDPVNVSEHARARRADRRSTNAHAARVEPVEQASTLRWWLLSAFVAVVALFVMLLESPVFEINDVQISGAARTSEGSILDALAISSDQALLTYDTSEGRDDLATLPWVETVDVTRQWPSSLRVVIRERTVAAAIGRPDGSEWAVVARDGMVVEYRMTPPSGVPLIVATQDIVDSSSIGSPVPGVDRALEIAHGLPLQLAPWVTTWSVDVDGVVVAELVGSARANFGALDDHRTQYVSLASILNGGADLVCIDTIDLSIADTPVLHRNASCLLASQELS